MPQTYSAGQVIYGKGTQVRYAVIAAGTATTRPLAAAFKLLKGVTTSEIKGGQETKEIPADYDSLDGDWKDSDPGSRSWGFTLQANTKVDTPQAASLQELWDAWGAGQYVYIERLKPNDTFWRGGLTFIVDPTEPSATDAIVTFGCGFTGKGALTKVAVAP